MKSDVHLALLPGLPFLTFRVKERLRKYAPGAELRLEREESALVRNTADREAYTAYLGPHPVGRFTIRETGDQIERVLFCVLPQPSPVASTAMHEGMFSESGSRLQDALRIASEHVRLLIYRAAGRPKALLKLAPWRDLADGGRYNKMSLLATMAALADRDGVPLLYAACEVDGKPFVLIPRRCNIGMSTDANETLDLDVGGYCATCEKALCAEHLVFAKSAEKTLMSEFIPQWNLVCAKDGTEIVPASSGQDAALKLMAALKPFLDEMNGNR
jgi:hypothetical protein